MKTGMLFGCMVIRWRWRRPWAGADARGLVGFDNQASVCRDAAVVGGVTPKTLADKGVFALGTVRPMTRLTCSLIAVILLPRSSRSP